MPGRKGWQQPPPCFAGTSLTPVINGLGERKPLLRSQHLPLPSQLLTPTAGFARAVQLRQTSPDLKPVVSLEGGEKKGPLHHLGHGSYH